MQHGLAAPAPDIGGPAHVEAVLGDVEIDVGEIHHAEVLQGLEEAVELIALEIGAHLLDQAGGALQHPAVEQGEVRDRHGMLGGHEIVQVAKEIAGGVAHLAVHVRELLHDPRPQRHVGGVIHRAHPQPQHVGAVGRVLLLVATALHQHGGIDHIAQGLAHLAALLVEGEAVGEHPPVGGVAVHRHRGEQAALEPAAVLVGALQVEIGGAAQPAPFEHPGPGGARVEPHVHGVGALAPLVGLSGPGRRQQARLVPLPPDVGAVLGDQLPGVGQGVGVEQHLARLPVIKDGDRHAPGALAGDAPVAPLAHHGLDAVAAAGGQPLHRRDGVEGLAAEPVHRGEPLFGGPEDGGLLGAPVVGITVFVALLGQQQPGVPQCRDDRRVGVLEHVEPGEGAGLLGEGAGLIHRAEHRQAVLVAGVEVVDPVARSGVHQAGARLGGDVVAAEHHRAGAIQEGVAVLEALQLGALQGEQGFEGALEGGAQALHQLGGHHQVAGDAAAARSVKADGVVELCVHRHRQVGGQGPGGGGPDGHEQLLPVGRIRGAVDADGGQGRGQRSRQLHHREGHVDAGGGVAVGVFQFRLGQGSAGTGAPVHRFQPPVDVAGQHHLAEDPDLGRLVGLLQGQIGLLPVGPDAPALEAALLDLDLLQGIGVGPSAQADRGQLPPLPIAQSLQHLQFDRQAVAVPARHEAGPAALQQGVLVDDVLEDLVEGMAHVQGAVGVGRPVMEGEGGAGVGAAQPPVEVLLLPEGLQLRFPHPGVRPHREGRLQQVERVLVGRRACRHVAGERKGGLSRLAATLRPIRLPRVRAFRVGRDREGHRSPRSRSPPRPRGLRPVAPRVLVSCSDSGSGSDSASGTGSAVGSGDGGPVSRGGASASAGTVRREPRRRVPSVASAGFPLPVSPPLCRAGGLGTDPALGGGAGGPPFLQPGPQFRDHAGGHLQQPGQGGAELGQAGPPAFPGPQPLPLLVGELTPAGLAHLHPEPADQQATAEHRQHRRAGQAFGAGDQHQPQQQHHRPPHRIPGPAEFGGQQGQQQHQQPDQQGQKASQGGKHGAKGRCRPFWALISGLLACCLGALRSAASRTSREFCLKSDRAHLAELVDALDLGSSGSGRGGSSPPVGIDRPSMGPAYRCPSAEGPDEELPPPPGSAAGGRLTAAGGSRAGPGADRTATAPRGGSLHGQPPGAQGSADPALRQQRSGPARPGHRRADRPPGS